MPPRNGGAQAVNPYYDQGKLHALQVMLCARLDELLNELGVTLFKSKRMYYGSCPIHGGDNPGAINLYHEGDTRPGFWKCNTRKCETHFKKTIIGFVRGVLSQQRFDWSHLPRQEEREKQPTVTWKDTVDWCCRFLGTDINGIAVDYGEMEKRRFAADVNALTRKPQQERQGLTRVAVRQHLQIPAAYFVGRGWSPELLDRYDVGFYPGTVDKQGRPLPLANRVAVPVYDNEYKVVAGFTGRSVFDACPSCSRWHHPDEACPDKGDRAAWTRTAKWYNHNFSKESYLYNFWFAKRHIREAGVVVVVEGPGDVWRLEEAGIHVGVALFGVHLSDEQQVMLEMSGALNVVVLTNNDEAGESGRLELKQRLGRSFRLHFPQLSAKDLGEMTVPQVKEQIGGLVTRLAERGY